MTKSLLIPSERIEQSIFFIRGVKVMLDRDLASLYGVETKMLKRAVKRNIDRFPKDFMFSLVRQNSEIGGTKLAPPILIGKVSAIRPWRSQSTES